MGRSDRGVALELIGVGQRVREHDGQPGRTPGSLARKQVVADDVDRVRVAVVSFDLEQSERLRTSVGRGRITRDPRLARTDVVGVMAIGVEVRARHGRASLRKEDRDSLGLVRGAAVHAERQVDDERQREPLRALVLPAENIPIGVQPGEPAPIEPAPREPGL